jgi:hypothetical protein
MFVVRPERDLVRRRCDRARHQGHFQAVGYFNCLRVIEAGERAKRAFAERMPEAEELFRMRPQLFLHKRTEISVRVLRRRPRRHHDGKNKDYQQTRTDKISEHRSSSTSGAINEVCIVIGGRNFAVTLESILRSFAGIAELWRTCTSTRVSHTPAALEREMVTL